MFGGLRARLGRPSLSMELNTPTTVDALLDQLSAAYPEVQAHRRILRVAVNGEYARPQDPIGPDDEVALIPPVAGG
ncbi:MAG: MoaD/ThiS family protein [Alphaproteobacteria bacterium]|nr:MoaD/ThiS family protein [Alphaproteobacteria bacterium]MCB9792403.1 MoaD/ThiS family protein [Alphaproteobacteria bacterium]